MIITWGHRDHHLEAPWPRPDIAAWWPAEIDFLREARASGVPVLGICFGAQLLAEALGGTTMAALHSPSRARGGTAVPSRDERTDRLLAATAETDGADLPPRVNTLLDTVLARLS